MSTSDSESRDASSTTGDDPAAPATPSRATSITFLPGTEHHSHPLSRSNFGSQYLPGGYSPPFVSRKERSGSLQHHSLSALMPTSSPHSTRSRSYSLSTTFPYNQSPRFNSSSTSCWSPMDSPMAAPFMPSLNGPPAVNETQRAMDSAMKRERARAKEMELAEETMTADELRAVLKKERSRMAKLSADLAAHKSAAVQSQAEAEVLEEGRINCLVRRLENLQKEKGRIIMELEQEEEMLTNTLQKKLDQVRAEKAQLEKQIEREQISRSDLKTKLSDLRKNSPACEQVPEEKEEEAEGDEATTAPDAAAAAAVTSES